MSATGIERRPRSVGLDAVRVVGLLAVVAGHVWTSDNVSEWLFSWHVPVFFLLAGYLWSPARSLAEDARRRATSMLVPYALWLVAICVLVELRQLVADGTLTLSVPARALYGGDVAKRPFTTFWFITALFFAVLLARLLLRLPWPWRFVVPTAGLGVGLTAGGALAQLPLAVGIAWPCSAFVLMGVALQRFRGKVRRPLPVGLVLLAISGAAIAAPVYRPLDLKGGEFGTPVLAVALAVLISVGLILTFEAVAQRIPPPVGVALSTAASNALIVVLLHPVVLWVLGTTSRTAGGDDFLLATAVPVLLTLALARIPLAAPLLGRPSAWSWKGRRLGV